MVLFALALAAPLVVPAYTAYSSPNDEGIPISQNGAGPWKDSKQSLVWIGDLKPGTLDIKIDGNSVDAQFVLQIDGVTKPINLDRHATFQIKDAGYRTITLKPALALGTEDYGTITGLTLTGTATEGARFNLKERRNCASVHLKYPTGKDQPVEWFYNEVRPKTDPKYTYYEACGWHRGYFGMQVNSPTERRIIFSVWDSGSEAVDRNKVGSDDRVRLLAKGDGVVAGDFGNEGTGGHSHLVYNWKTNEVHRFLVHAEPQGDATIYTGYYYFNDKKKWGLIAKFRAPKDGSYMHGLYSFNENFGGSNGNLQRKAEFGPVFLAGPDKKWHEQLQAQFSCDGTGKNDRFDYASGAVGDHWFLSNGGAVSNGVKFGDLFTRKPSRTKPPRDFPKG
ncbi:MAG: DUF3472 domain-containing protein [Armatimonadetes bacterium]|nr:DUF3472 domain-containing protein [Armatimonadota bacterium]